ncbi:hypothetical protein G7Y89_g2693 [Cudoniella acicularis]|uniref:Transglycosylase SLT domain-containing protein n=1 Tax=Cudoniella acicularis TaxID=354080 RepID=A0A8H4RSX4_9HELO|nr:hypothetical protein G7Y89_g2693 [Cudoniella acicularis]
MSSTAAFIFLLSLASQSLAAPAAYDNGQWDASKYGDGAYTWKPASVASVVVPTTAPVPTSIAPAPTTVVTSSSVAATSVAPAPAPASSAPGAASSVAPAPAPASSAPGAASSVAPAPAPASSAPATSSATPAGPGRGPTRSGDGSGSGWPSVSDWIPFEQMWSLNLNLINTQCTGGIQNSAEETQAIHDGIESAAKQFKVDDRYILATIMQESKGCVRVPSTSLGVSNPGLLQDHDGDNNCSGAPVGGCSTSTINGMIVDGVNGTLQKGADGGNGLSQLITKAATLGGTSESQNVYIAARLYNSGDNSYKTGDDLSNPPDATASYCEDIANRMIGYVF